MTDGRSETSFTSSGVRLRRRVNSPSGPDWLLVPGGPGIGSESLAGLAALLTGTVWLVDLPGDGSNRRTQPGDPYLHWPDAVAEACEAVPGSIAIGHSIGGMQLLATPAVQHHVAGLVLLSSAPHAGGMTAPELMATRHPLPDPAAYDAAVAAYAAAPSDAHARRVSLAMAAWSFTAEHLADGVGLLDSLPYNHHAMEWSAAHFDSVYAAAWWPADLPTLILSGREDILIDQRIWDDPQWRTSGVHQVWIDGAAHFPWIERPAAVATALRRFAGELEACRAPRHPGRPVD